MQIDRLFEIIYILLNKKSVTAKELADRFGVSKRTIYRDIDTLSLAGIPLYTNRGKSGGIGLLDEFVLDKSLLKESEQTEILTALQGLSAVKTDETDNLLKKLVTFWSRSVPNWVEVDFSDWSYSDNGYLNNIKNAILTRRVISFDYYGANSEMTRRQVEPVQLWFKHRAWYLKAFCLEKNDMRTFRLTRIRNLHVLDEVYRERGSLTALTNLTPEVPVRRNIAVTLKISPEMAYRVYDDFDDSQVNKASDGSFIVNVIWPEDEWVYGFIMSFGEYAEVIAPENLKKIVSEKLNRALKKYL